MKTQMLDNTLNYKTILAKQNMASSQIAHFLPFLQKKMKKSVIFSKVSLALFASVFLLSVASCSGDTYRTAVEGINGGGGSSSASTTPEIVFTDNVSQAPVQSDTVVIEVRNFPGGDPSTYKYTLISSTGTCDSGTNFTSASDFTSGTALTFNNQSAGYNHNSLCAKAEDGSGKILYQKSAYPLNIDTTKPTIGFVAAGNFNIEVGPVKTDTVQITVKDNEGNLDSASLKYGFSADNVCDTQDTYNQTYIDKTSFTINNESHNGNYLCATVKDLAGNTNYLRSANKINIDITKPTMEFTAEVAVGPIGSDTVNIKVTDSNPQTATYKYVFVTGNCDATTFFPASAATFTSETPFVLNTTTNNGKYLCAKAEDTLGNTSYLKSVNKVNIDVAKPAITFEYPPTGSTGWKQTYKVKIIVNAGDDTDLNTGSYQYVWVNATTLCDNNVDFTSASSFTNNAIITATSSDNGKHLCAKAATSVANNTGYGRSEIMKIDNTAPSALTFDKDVFVGPVKQNPIQISFTEANMGTAGTAKYGFVSSPASCTTAFAATTDFTNGTAFTITSNSNNGKYICAVVTDEAGNKAAKVSSEKLNIDTSVPSVTLTNTPSNPSKDTVLDVTVSGSGVVEYQYKVASGTTCSSGGYSSFTAVSSKITDSFSGNSDGDMVLCVIGKDAAGNVQTTPTLYTWKKDTTAPTATIANAPSGTSNTTTLNVTIAGTDVTHYKYKIGEQGSTNCGDSNGYSASEISVGTKIENDISSSPSLSDGNIRLCVVGKDQAGNWQTYTNATSTDWIKDTTPPANPITLTDTPSDPSYDTALNVTVGGTDVSHYKFKVGDKTSTDCSVAAGYSSTEIVADVSHKITSAIGATGNKRLCVIARDAAGNWQTYTNATVYEWERVDTLTVTVNQSSASPNQSDPTNALPIYFDVVFNLPIDTSTFTASDITQAATSGASSAVTWELTTAGGDTNLASGDKKHFKLKAMSGTHVGKIIPSIAANQIDFASDSSLKNSASTSTDNVVEYTLVKPNVTVNQASGQADPVNIVSSSSPIVFDVVFDREINTASFDTNDITQSGNASAITWELTTASGNSDLTTGDKKTFKLKATAATASVATGNTLIPSIAANAVQSIAGNNNNASSSTDNSVTLDTTAPTLTFSNAPSGTVNPANLDVVVNTTNGAVQYQYALQNGTTCGSYGSWVNISQKIQNSLAALSNGSVILCAKGKDAAGNVGTAVTATWTKDNSIAQAIATANLPTGTNNTTSLNITVGGTSVTHYKYKILDSSSSDHCYDAGGYTGGTTGITVGTFITDNIGSKAEGTIRLCLLGYNGTNWQQASSGSVYTWTKDTTPPTISSAETMDKNHDGKIDGYKITFTEAVDDSTFTNANWAVSSHSGVTRNTSFTGDTADDETIYISFAQNSGACNLAYQNGCDTGSKPDLTMTAGGLSDSYGNSIVAVQSGTIQEADRAVPVVIAAQAPSNLSVRLIFSENVKATTAECGAGSSQSSVSCSTLYGITGGSGLSISKAVIESGSTSGNKVMLTTAQQTQGTSYTVTATVGTVKDVNGNAVIGGSNTATFTGAAPALVLVSAEATNNTTVKIKFNEPLNVSAPATTTTSNYLVGGLTVSGVVVDTSDTTNKTLLLTTSTQTSDSINGYTVTVVSGNVPAQNATSGTCNAPNNTAKFTGDRLPEVVSVSSINKNTVFVTFSEDVKFTTATEGALNVGNYVINNSLTPSSPTSQSANTIVKLTTTDQVIDAVYRLTVSNVKDINGNVMHPTLNYGNFIGVEKLKLLTARNVWGSSDSFGIFRLSFSKPFQYSGNGSGTNAADNLANYSFPFPGATVSLCTSGDDNLCPSSYTEGSDTEIYFKVAPKPSTGAYTIVAATAAGSPTGAAGCLLPEGTSDTTNCLKPNPDDRAAISWWMPVNVDEGSAYDDPFNDNTTFSGQVVQYNGKLLIGPNDTDSGLFMTDINLQNSTNIVLDSDDSVTGIQTFKDNPTGDRVYDHGTVPLAGIDYMYAACDKGDSTLSGTACTAAPNNGTERLYIVGYVTETGGYQSVWITQDKVSPFSFKHVTGLSNHGERTFRAMSVRLFKGKVYQAQQHQKGSYPPRASRYTPNGTLDTFTGSGNDLAWRYIDRLGDMAAKRNGQWDAYSYPSNPSNKKTQLVSIDYMYEYDNDGSGINESQLYMANGGSCVATDLTNHSRTFNDVDGGIVRSTSTFSTLANPPGSCKSTDNAASRTYCKTIWADVTPGGDLGDGVSATLASNKAAYIWNHYMSKALPQDPTHDDTNSNDWDNLIPANTIAPSIKAIAKMVEFNGDLYAIRNACAVVNVETLNSTVHDTCPAGSERPQLWRLPKDCGTATQCAQAWQFIGDTTSATAAIKYTTRMGGAEWKDGTNQDTKTAKNKYITLLEAVGDKLYVGFDNEDGINVWRTKSTVTASNPPTSESDFEAACQTGNECAQPYKQFGLRGNIADIDVKIFDSVAVNDAGTDYLIMNARSGTKPLRIYRQGNN